MNLDNNKKRKELNNQLYSNIRKNIVEKNEVLLKYY